MPDKAQIFHMELIRRLNTPWEPPYPYKADEAAVFYARDRLGEVMESFEEVINQMDNYQPPNEYGRGRHEALEQVKQYVVKIKELAEESSTPNGGK